MLSTKVPEDPVGAVVFDLWKPLLQLFVCPWVVIAVVVLQDEELFYDRSHRITL